MGWLSKVPLKVEPRKRDAEKTGIEQRLGDVERRVALLEAEARVRKG